jgi:hypothetical protein
MPGGNFYHASTCSGLPAYPAFSAFPKSAILIRVNYKRKEATRKCKLEIALLQAQIQKMQMEIRQADSSILIARLENLEKAFEIVDKNFPYISSELKLAIVTKLLAIMSTPVSGG